MHILSFITQKAALQYGGFKEWALAIIQQKSLVIMQQETKTKMHTLSTNNSKFPAGPSTMGPNTSGSNITAQQASSRFVL